ncbi:MAG TPA: polymer-forming cytoskeletal protein [Pyrinomonadaceae bacterium]|nr:polymer-forming cytoskeletal protein [Pyrinomonadaceae bacterium]
MLRMGKNPKVDQGDSENTMDSKATPQYNASPSYQSQPSAEPTAYRSTAEPSSSSSSSPRAVTESESLARDIKEGTLSGFVGNGTVLTGEATFKAMLRVDGHLSGRVSSESGTLIVGNNGQVDADVQVAVAVIHGTVNGDIVASQRLELGRAAKVNGNIQTPSLVIEQGALFEGSCRMAQLKTALDSKQRDAEKPSDNGALAESMPVVGENAAAAATAPGDFSSMSSEVAS